MPRMHAPTAVARTLTLAAATAAIAMPTLVAQAQDAVQWRGEDGGNGHWYQRVALSNGEDFDQARDIAVSIGADLASVASQEEDQFIAALAGGVVGRGVIIGTRVTDPNCNVFTWTDGSPWTYENWAPASQPDCVLGQAVGYYENGWHDLQVSDIDAAMFEWSADCNEDGIVDYGQILDGTFVDDDEDWIPDCCANGSCLPPVQWRIEDGGNGHWYQWIGCCPSYEDGKATAASLGGHIMTFGSMEEERFVEDTFVSGWLALELNGDGEYEWTTGEPLDYTNWAEGQPYDEGSNYYLVVSDKGFSNDSWTTAPLNGGSSVIIEWSADCNGDGIVDYGQILDGTFADDDGNGIPDACPEIFPPVFVFIDHFQWSPSRSVAVDLVAGDYWIQPEANPGGLGGGLSAWNCCVGNALWSWQFSMWDSNDDDSANLLAQYTTGPNSDDMSA
ncbi:MAG: hypothetical protein CMJ23_07495, partial [Phycisphaerae bacterium]|nr:hypothetical protein [Phycisphaerae bacterium]